MKNFIYKISVDLISNIQINEFIITFFFSFTDNSVHTNENMFSQRTECNRTNSNIEIVDNLCVLTVVRNI